MIGTTLGRYRIVAKLGEDSLGSVWRAEDPLLGRTVALRLLAPQLAASDLARERFLSEARASSILEHPGIAAVRDSGEVAGHLYVAYQFVEGETLAARLAAGEVFAPAALARVGAAVADALAHAHERGRLHQALTCASIAVRPDGSPVITDFGLANQILGDVSETPDLTLEFVHNLAPEQRRGLPPEKATDLWALGAVLFEAATGRPPYAVGSAELLRWPVLHEKPTRPSTIRADLPAAFDALVLQLLQEEPRKRPSSAAAVAILLRAIAEGQSPSETIGVPGSEPPTAAVGRWWRRLARRRLGLVQATGVVLAAVAVVWTATLLAPRLLHSREPVLAVLPMQIAGGDSTEAVVAAEALGEQLAGRLRSAGGFRVLPWITTGRPLTPDTSLAMVAKGLRATELLRGTITTGDEDTRVRVSLVDGRTGRENWSQELSAPVGDFSVLQGLVAISVAERMTGRTGDKLRSRIAHDAPSNPDAYAYFIRGSAAWHSGDLERMQSARAFFEQSLELDSTLAAAWVALGATLVDAVAHVTERDSAWLTAKQCFERALRLQPALPAAERGLISLIYETDSGTQPFSHMLEIAARALQRGPNDVDQLTTAVWGFTLASQPELALPVIEHTLKLDPGNQSVAYYLVLALGAKFMPYRCISAGADYVRRFGEDVEVLAGMGGAAMYLGRYDEAIVYLERSVELVGEHRWNPCKSMLIRAYAGAGDTARAGAARRRVREELSAKLANDSTAWAVQYALYNTSTDEQERRRRLERFDGLDGSGASGESDDPELNMIGSGEALAESYARAGRMDEARLMLRRTSPQNEQLWFTGRPGSVVDSLGDRWETDEPAIQALRRTPEAIALHSAQEAHMVALFNRYRPVVAAALPTGSAVPPLKTKWWRGKTW